jgi:thiamine biosynthesis lipoprotein
MPMWQAQLFKLLAAARGMSFGPLAPWLLVIALSGPQLACVTASAVGPDAASNAEERYAFEQAHLGTLIRILLYAPTPQLAEAAAQAAFDRIEELDLVLSDYKPDSELNRLCAKSDTHPLGQPWEISKDLYQVLAAAQDLSRKTEGAFDVTTGPYVRLWRRARRRSALPDEEKLSAAAAASGHWKLELKHSPPRASLGARGMRLDLGGIAKGYILDEALVVLKFHGIQRALIDAGGDLIASGPPPDQAGWHVNLEHIQIEPTPDPKQTANATNYLLSHAALATSGDAYQFLEFNAVRYSHLIDPKTGLGCTQSWTASVAAPSAMAADAWASALCILGPERGLALLENEEGLGARVSSSDCRFESTRFRQGSTKPE